MQVGWTSRVSIHMFGCRICIFYFVVFRCDRCKFSISCRVYGTDDLRLGCKRRATCLVLKVTARLRQVGRVSYVRGWIVVEERFLLTLVSKILFVLWRMMVGRVASRSVLVGSCLPEVPMRGG